MFFRTLIVAVLACLAVPASAADRIVDVSSVEGVASLLREAGYKAEIKKDDSGDAYIQSGVNGDDFQLIFYGCTNNKSCDSFEFFSWYKKEPFFSNALANEWNAQKRFLKIVVDKDGDISEYLYVSAVGGTTFENFKDYVEWYGSMSAELGKFLDEKRKAAGGKRGASI